MSNLLLYIFIIQDQFRIPQSTWYIITWIQKKNLINSRYFWCLEKVFCLSFSLCYSVWNFLVLYLRLYLKFVVLFHDLFSFHRGSLFLCFCLLHTTLTTSTINCHAYSNRNNMRRYIQKQPDAEIQTTTKTTTRNCDTTI